jgi:hypothetical protein
MIGPPWARPDCRFAPCWSNNMRFASVTPDLTRKPSITENVTSRVFPPPPAGVDEDHEIDAILSYAGVILHC